MAVNDRVRISLLVLLSLLCLSCSAESEGDASKSEVLKLASERVAVSTAKLGERIEQCSRELENNPVPVLDKRRAASLGASQDDLIVALGYLSFRNSFNCEREARLSMAFDLGTLAMVKRYYDENPGDIDEVRHKLVYPPVDQLVYAVTYSKLAPEIKQFVAQAVGDSPFDLFEALEKNDLLQE